MPQECERNLKEQENTAISHHTALRNDMCVESGARIENEKRAERVSRVE